MCSHLQFRSVGGISWGYAVVLLAAYTPGFMAQRVAGNVTIGPLLTLSK